MRLAGPKPGTAPAGLPRVMGIGTWGDGGGLQGPAGFLVEMGIATGEVPSGISRAPELTAITRPLVVCPVLAARRAPWAASTGSGLVTGHWHFHVNPRPHQHSAGVQGDLPSVFAIISVNRTP